MQNSIPERVLELKDLYESSQILNEIGFSLFTESLKQEAREFGFSLSDLAQEGKKTPSSNSDVIFRVDLEKSRPFSM